MVFIEASILIYFLVYSPSSSKHESGVIHCDLKFESVVFENNGPRAAIKVTDFGFSKKLMTGGKATNTGGPGAGSM